MGGKTHVISIPAEYIRKYGLQKGDELDFEDNGPNITFKNEKLKSIEKIQIKFNENENIEKALKCLYERGYDEIELSLEKVSITDIENIITSMPGFELVCSSKNNCTIKCISEVNILEFENMLRRIFLMIKSIPETMSEKKQSLIKIATAQRLTLFCKRCLSKKEFQNYSRTLVYYSLLNEISSILACYETVIKEKSPPIKELSLAAEAAYDAFYASERTKDITISLIKSSPYAASIGLGLSKIVLLAQSLKIA